MLHASVSNGARSAAQSFERPGITARLRSELGPTRSGRLPVVRRPTHVESFRRTFRLGRSAMVAVGCLQRTAHPDPSHLPSSLQMLACCEMGGSDQPASI